MTPLRSSMVLWLFLVASPSPALQSGDELTPSETVEKFSESGHEEKANYVITSKGDWKRLWKIVHSVRSPRPALPRIDFSERMVIAVFDGEQGDSRNSISITKLIRSDDALHVFVKETAGSPLCPPGPPVTVQPYDIIQTERIKKPSKNVFFEDAEQEMQKCP